MRTHRGNKSHYFDNPTIGQTLETNNDIDEFYKPEPSGSTLTSRKHDQFVLY